MITHKEKRNEQIPWQRKSRPSLATIATLTKISESNKKQMIEWGIKFNALKDNLAITSVDALSEEIEHWKETAEEMRQSYEKSINILTPREI